MNYPDPAGRPWCYPDNADEAAAAVAAIDSSTFAYMSGGYSTDDLFELVWPGGGGGGSNLQFEQPPVVSLRLSPPPPPVRPGPPSDDEMAAWLYAIVKGEDHAQDSSGGGSGSRWTGLGRHAPPKEPGGTPSTGKREKHGITEGLVSKDTRRNSNESQKMIGGARRSHSHHGETHKLTEKRRRYKIKERLKTLKQLVLGCDKQSGHASTLEQTIQYMKSLQKQVQTMSALPARPATAAAPAVCPGAPPQYVHPGTPVAVAPMVLGPAPMVPLGAVLPCRPYPAAVMISAAPAPLYPAAAAPLAPAAGSHWHGSTRGKGTGSSLRRKE